MMELRPAPKRAKPSRWAQRVDMKRCRCRTCSICVERIVCAHLKRLRKAEARRPGSSFETPLAEA